MREQRIGRVAQRTAVFPDATVQTCIVHLLRNSLDFVSFKDRRAVATALKSIYAKRSKH
jgi:transposase-like protein